MFHFLYLSLYIFSKIYLSSHRVAKLLEIDLIQVKADGMNFLSYQTLEAFFSYSFFHLHLIYLVTR